MKKKVKDFFLEDFEKNYKYKPNKEEILANIEEETGFNKEVYSLLRWKKLSITLMTCMLVIILGLGIISIVQLRTLEKDKDIITDEFKEYMNSYGDMQVLLEEINIRKDYHMYIYKVGDSLKIDNNTSYLYIYKCNEKENKILLVINETKQQLFNNSYGILAQNTDQVSFSIEINDQKYEYKIG